MPLDACTVRAYVECMQDLSVVVESVRIALQILSEQGKGLLITDIARSIANFVEDDQGYTYDLDMLDIALTCVLHALATDRRVCADPSMTYLCWNSGIAGLPAGIAGLSESELN